MIFCVDFDGTLVHDKYPEIGEPMQHVIDFVIRLKQQGNEIILWTSRTDDQLQAAVEWCAQHGIIFDAVNDNLQRIKEQWGGNTRKVYCDWYIDDKALHPDKLL